MDGLASRARAGWHALVFTGATVGTLGVLSLLTDEPFVFPSLGPTAFLLFTTPLVEASAPRVVLGGHLIGVLAGWGALAVFGLLDSPAFFAAPIDANRIATAALALALTSGVMVWTGLVHPPAGATTLIVALGVLRRPGELAVLIGAVVLLVAQVHVCNRVAGLDVPRWSSRT
ncbi:hypothetical protein BH24ACT3_BH24ACT3_00230 [soil metagenome]